MRLGTVSDRTTVLLLLGAFAILCLHGLVWDSPTVDEIAYLPSGYFYLKTGDFALAPRTPPLVKELAALPLLPLDPQIRTAKPARESAWYPWSSTSGHEISMARPPGSWRSPSSPSIPR